VTEQLVLCNHDGPFKDANPCPLQHGHDGGHVYWTQTRPDSKRGRNGIWIVDENGKTLMHATFDGAADPEDICALMALSEAMRKEPSA